MPCWPLPYAKARVTARGSINLCNIDGAALDILLYLYKCTNMKIKETISQLSALAQDTRLEAFRLLVRMGDAGLPAGEIADRLDANGTTMSRHLATMVQAGLLVSERRARNIIYRVDFCAVRDLFTFLLEDCCAGDSRVLSGSCQEEGGSCDAIEQTE